MKLATALIALSVIPFNTMLAQGDWCLQNPLPTQSTLHSVCFVNADVGWAAGEDGTIVATTDGGRTWYLQEACNADHISQVFFVDTSYGWAMGYRLTGLHEWGISQVEHIILRTTDGGSTWAVQFILGTEYSGPYVNAVFFVDRAVGWMAGDVGQDGARCSILKTTDGGEHWSLQKSTDVVIYSIFFVDAMTGWAVGGWSSAYEVTILKTSDGGDNWTDQSGGMTGVLRSVYFIDSNTGWAVGGSNILKTTDGGITWMPKPSAGSDLSTVWFLDASSGFAGGWCPFLHTTDGGESWVEEQDSYAHFLSLCFADDSTGWRVGWLGRIQKTTDGGSTWSYQSRSFTYSQLAAVDFVDPLSGWVLDRWGSIYHTGDGGVSWELQDSLRQDAVLNELFLLDRLHGWVVGGQWGSGMILHTSDGGKHWEEQSSNTNGELRGVTFIDESTGWAVGDSGTILFTEDGGAIWSNHEEGNTGETFYALEFVGPDHGWVAGNGFVLRTENGGADWERDSLSSPDYRLWVDFVDSLHGWVTGSACWSDVASKNHTQNIAGCARKIWCTNDGGRNWAPQFDSSGSIGSLIFLDTLSGWAVGYEVLYTQDGGNSWTRRDIPVGGQIADIDFADPTNGWMVGDNGTILHTSDGGITFVEEILPAGIAQRILLQPNYPNPFNPNTTIEFTLPHAAYATLRVYNLLGEEVAALLSGDHAAGTFRATWNASASPSGVYFYRLTAGEYAQTRKMMLMR